MSNRHVHIAGITRNPDARRIKETARNVTDPDFGFLVGIRCLIMDRDTNFTAEYRDILKLEGIKAVRLPSRSPDLNALPEQYVRTIKESRLNRMIFFGEHPLRTANDEFVQHYHHERNHEGLGNRLIDPIENVGINNGPIECRQRLGGLLQYYHRQAA